MNSGNIIGEFAGTLVANREIKGKKLRRDELKLI